MNSFFLIGYYDFMDIWLFKKVKNRTDIRTVALWGKGTGYEVPKGWKEASRMLGKLFSLPAQKLHESSLGNIH
jgi:hypothetical protein